jgi:hypothetical protein
MGLHFWYAEIPKGSEMSRSSWKSTDNLTAKYTAVWPYHWGMRFLLICCNPARMRTGSHMKPQTEPKQLLRVSYVRGNIVAKASHMTEKKKGT